MSVHVDRHFLGLCLLLFLLHVLDVLSTDFRFESNPVVVSTIETWGLPFCHLLKFMFLGGLLATSLLLFHFARLEGSEVIVKFLYATIYVISGWYTFVVTGNIVSLWMYQMGMLGLVEVKGAYMKKDVEGITERKRMEEKLRESEERFRNLYESIQDPVGVFLGREGRLIDYNKAFKRLSGCTDEELKNKTFLDFVHPDDQAIVLERYRTRYPEEELPLIHEIRGVNKKGEIIPLEISVSTYKVKGKVVGIEVICRDITERKQAEEKLKEYSERLEEMVGQRTKELRDAQEKLVRKEKLVAIGQLAASIGHELRNSIGVIKNSSYFLNMKLKDVADEKVMKHLKIVEREVNSVNQIISDLLEFARKKPPTLQETDLNHVVTSALSCISIPETVKVTTKLGETPRMLLDQEQIRRVFQNIILNAVQAMPEGGKLIIQTSKHDDSVEIEFKDTGVGIPKENLPKLFTPLFSTKAKGLGLGLAICKQLVEGHGGNITVKSKVGEGSTFTVRLPVERRVESEE